MLLTIDIGNSNIVVGKGETTVFETHRFQTDIHKSGDEYYHLMRHLFEDVNAVIIASVVPQLNTLVKYFIIKYFGIQPIFVGPGVKTGVKILTDNPKEVGADLVAGAAGVLSQYGQHAIIIDMGTATTFTLLKDGEIKGVAITIGLISSKDSLISRASKLLQFEFEIPKHVLGSNTIDSLNAGLVYGHTCQITGMVDKIKSTYRLDDIPVIITGGASAMIASLLPKTYQLDEHLILKGLQAIYKKQR